MWPNGAGLPDPEGARHPCFVLDPWSSSAHGRGLRGLNPVAELEALLSTFRQRGPPGSNTRRLALSVHGKRSEPLLPGSGFGGSPPGRSCTACLSHSRGLGLPQLVTLLPCQA